MNTIIINNSIEELDFKNLKIGNQFMQIIESQNKDIHKYRISKALYYILYLDGKKNPNEKLITYLEDYKEKLESRREVKKNRINWWELQWSRDEKIFQDIKIVARQRNRRNDFALVSDEFYASADVYYITPKDTKINMYYILAYLNSEVFYRWFKLQGKNKGEFLELYSTPLKEVPIIYEYDENKMNYIVDLIQRQIVFSKNIAYKLRQRFNDR
jgi:adenine-specific DNA-methyltransferase